MERLLLKISLIISILGILILFFISNNMQAKQVKNYNDLKLNDYIRTTSRIIYVNSYDEFSVIKLENNITVTCNCKFKVNETIEVYGRVIEYENILEVEANKIIKNDN